MRNAAMVTAAGALALSLGCATSSKPEIRDIRANVSGLDVQGVNMIFDVDVYNPYGVAIRSPQFRYGIDIAGSAFVDAGEQTGIDLPGRKVGTVALPARFEYQQLWEMYQSIAGADEIDYRLHGAILLNAMGESLELPVEHRGKLPVFRMPKFSVPRVKMSEVTLTSAKVLLETDVENPNVFPLGLRDVHFDVALGDVPVGSVTSTTGNLRPRAKGKLTLHGEVTAAGALLQLASGRRPGVPQINWSGSLDTPYGPVPLRR